MSRISISEGFFHRPPLQKRDRHETGAVYVKRRTRNGHNEHIADALSGVQWVLCVEQLIIKFPWLIGSDKDATPLWRH